MRQAQHDEARVVRRAEQQRGRVDRATRDDHDVGAVALLAAASIDDDLRGDVLPFADPASRRGDVTIFHFALPSPMTEAFRSLKGARILQYHNIPPAADGSGRTP